MQSVRRPPSGKTSAGLSSPRDGGAGGRAGGTAAHGLCPDAHAPDPSRRLLPRRPVPAGAASGAVRGARTSGRTMTLLPASNASADPRTGRPPALEAGSPTGRRFPDEGKGFRAPRASSSRFQPCGSRTRRSCCNQSQDRPIVLARSRFLSPGSARPGRS